ncbi:hypothetical protein A3Q56_04771 [Intoshia linei]|uniref:NF-kappa-B-activating protein C-terminal domain-containing protein n=1 Tax=Intoshia linei TaxID=1819745 RepID=A0A177B1G8_9BILA|nr:hypothetical protein A3Q56_04771 [Intoshia linei]
MFYRNAEKRLEISQNGVETIWIKADYPLNESNSEDEKIVKKKRHKKKKDKNVTNQDIPEHESVEILEDKESSDSEIFGPKAYIEETSNKKMKLMLLPGEGDAMASYVVDGKRIPRRGEIGLTASEIESYETTGYVMSGSRNRRVEAVRLRKENEIYSVNERKELVNFTKKTILQRENKIINQFKDIIYKEKSINGKFMHEYIYGQRTYKCSIFLNFYKQCIKFQQTKNEQDATDLLEFEKKNLQQRLASIKNNNVWQYT